MSLTAVSHVPEPDLREVEAERLEALDRYDVIGTPREEAFDRITRLAQKFFDVPVAIVSFIDAHRQWYKSYEGLDIDEVPRRDSFCKNVIASGQALIVPDASKDPRFADSPLVQGAPHIRFYASIPLTTRDQHHIGALCIIDMKPRDFPAAQIEIMNDLAQMVMDELELRLCADHDALTGLLSRRAFKEQAERTTALALRHHYCLTAITFDLDHFKTVNDTYGHAAGDRVLTDTARLCREMVRTSDLIGRLGGEEFVVLLPNTPQEGGQEVAEKLRLAIAHQVVDFKDQRIRLTASFGVASLDASTRDTASLLESADKALYESKAAGRNRISVWRTPSSLLKSRRRVFKGGAIVFNGGTSVMDCTVRSLSDEGAGLDVSSSVGVPNTFRLAIRSDGLEMRAQVIERTPKHVEVAFV